MSSVVSLRWCQVDGLTLQQETTPLPPGRDAKANHNGAFVWADNTGADLASVAAGQFVVRAGGGIWLGTTSAPTATAGRFIETSTGGYLTTGGTWTNSSDQNLKENFTPIDRQELLELLSTLPISRWNYKTEDDGAKHIGPTAQDFYARFGLGGDDKAISTIDPAGIALAAIQELYRKTKEIDELRAELAELRGLIEHALHTEADSKTGGKLGELSALTTSPSSPSRGTPMKKRTTLGAMALLALVLAVISAEAAIRINGNQLLEGGADLRRPVASLSAAASGSGVVPARLIFNVGQGVISRGHLPDTATAKWCGLQHWHRARL